MDENVLLQYASVNSVEAFKYFVLHDNILIALLEDPLGNHQGNSALCSDVDSDVDLKKWKSGFVDYAKTLQDVFPLTVTYCFNRASTSSQRDLERRFWKALLEFSIETTTQAQVNLHFVNVLIVRVK